jgi:hypothetical protein
MSYPFGKYFIIPAFLLIAAACAAQEAPLASRTLLKFSPQHLIASTLQVGVEQFNRSYSRSWNLSVGVRYQQDMDEQVHRGANIRGAEANFQYRTYLRPIQKLVNQRNKTFAQGLYVGSFVDAGMFSVDSEEKQVSGSPPWESWIASGAIYDTRHIAGGFTVGLQRTFGKALTIDVFAGGGFRHAAIEMISNRFNSTVGAGDLQQALPGFFPRIGFNVGILL